MVKKDFKKELMYAIKDVKCCSTNLDSCDRSIWLRKWTHIEDLFNHLE